MNPGFAAMSNSSDPSSSVKVENANPLNITELNIENVELREIQKDHVLKITPDKIPTQESQIPSYGRYITISNNHGFIIVGISTSLYLFYTRDAQDCLIAEQNKDSGQALEQVNSLPQIIHTKIETLPTNPVTHVALMGSEQQLIVALFDGTVQTYNVADIAKGNAKHTKSFQLLDKVIDIKPNPDITSSIVSVLLMSGKVKIIDVGSVAAINDLSTSILFSSICWSRKGKQIAVGTPTGTVHTMVTTGAIKRTIELPEKKPVLSLNWLDNFTFLVVCGDLPNFNDISGDYSHDFKLYIVTQNDKKSNIQTLEIVDPCLPWGLTFRGPQRYYAELFSYGTELDPIVFMAASASTDIACIGRTKIPGASDNMQWCLLNLPESQGARLSFSKYDSSSDTSSLGMVVDLTSNLFLPPINPDESDTPTKPVPLLWVLTTDGCLMGYHIVNTTEAEKGVSYPAMAQALVPIGTNSTSASGNSLSFGSALQGNASSVSSFGQSAFGASQSLASNATTPAFGSSSFGMPSKPVTGSNPTFGQPAFGQLPASSASNNQNTTNVAFGLSSFGKAANSGLAFSQPSFGQTAFGKPADSAPSFGKSGFGQIAQNAPTFGQSAFGKTADSVPTFGQSVFGKAAGSAPSFGQSGFAKIAQNAPAFGQSAFGKSADNTPVFGASTFGKATESGPSAFGQSGFAKVAQDAPAFGKSAFSQNPSSFSSFGQSPFGKATGSSGAFGQSAFGNQSDTAPAPAPAPTSTHSGVGSNKGSGSVFGSSSLGKLSVTTSAFGKPTSSQTSASGKATEPSSTFSLTSSSKNESFGSLGSSAFGSLSLNNTKSGEASSGKNLSLSTDKLTADTSPFNPKSEPAPASEIKPQPAKPGFSSLAPPETPMGLKAAGRKGSSISLTATSQTLEPSKANEVSTGSFSFGSAFSQAAPKNSAQGSVNLQDKLGISSTSQQSSQGIFGSTLAKSAGAEGFGNTLEKPIKKSSISNSGSNVSLSDLSLSKPPADSLKSNIVPRKPASGSHSIFTPESLADISKSSFGFGSDSKSSSTPASGTASIPGSLAKAAESKEVAEKLQMIESMKKLQAETNKIMSTQFRDTCDQLDDEIYNLKQIVKNNGELVKNLGQSKLSPEKTGKQKTIFSSKNSKLPLITMASLNSEINSLEIGDSVKWNQIFDSLEASFHNTTFRTEQLRKILAELQTFQYFIELRRNLFLVLLNPRSHKLENPPLDAKSISTKSIIEEYSSKFSKQFKCELLDDTIDKLSSIEATLLSLEQKLGIEPSKKPNFHGSPSVTISPRKKGAHEYSERELAVDTEYLYNVSESVLNRIHHQSNALSALNNRISQLLKNSETKSSSAEGEHPAHLFPKNSSTRYYGTKEGYSMEVPMVYGRRLIQGRELARISPGALQRTTSLANSSVSLTPISKPGYINELNKPSLSIKNLQNDATDEKLPPITPVLSAQDYLLKKRRRNLVMSQMLRSKSKVSVKPHSQLTQQPRGIMNNLDLPELTTSLNKCSLRQPVTVSTNSMTKSIDVTYVLSNPIDILKQNVSSNESLSLNTKISHGVYFDGSPVRFSHKDSKSAGKNLFEASKGASPFPSVGSSSSSGFGNFKQVANASGFSGLGSGFTSSVKAASNQLQPKGLPNQKPQATVASSFTPSHSTDWKCKRCQAANRELEITCSNCGKISLDQKLYLIEMTKKKAEEERFKLEKIERERLELVRLEKERLEQERLEREQIEHERLGKEQIEGERIEEERLEKQRIESLLFEQERMEKELAEQEKIEQDARKKEIELKKLLKKAKQELRRDDKDKILDNELISEEIENTPEHTVEENENKVENLSTQLADASISNPDISYQLDSINSTTKKDSIAEINGAPGVSAQDARDVTSQRTQPTKSAIDSFSFAIAKAPSNAEAPKNTAQVQASSTTDLAPQTAFDDPKMKGFISGIFVKNPEGSSQKSAFSNAGNSSAFGNASRSGQFLFQNTNKMSKALERLIEADIIAPESDKDSSNTDTGNDTDFDTDFDTDSDINTGTNANTSSDSNLDSDCSSGSDYESGSKDSNSDSGSDPNPTEFQGEADEGSFLSDSALNSSFEERDRSLHPKNAESAPKNTTEARLFVKEVEDNVTESFRKLPQNPEATSSVSTDGTGLPTAEGLITTLESSRLGDEAVENEKDIKVATISDSLVPDICISSGIELKVPLDKSSSDSEPASHESKDDFDEADKIDFIKEPKLSAPDNISATPNSSGINVKAGTASESNIVEDSIVHIKNLKISPKDQSDEKEQVQEEQMSQKASFIHKDSALLEKSSVSTRTLVAIDDNSDMSKTEQAEPSSTRTVAPSLETARDNLHVEYIPKSPVLVPTKAEISDSQLSLFRLGNSGPSSLESSPQEASLSGAVFKIEPIPEKILDNSKIQQITPELAINTASSPGEQLDIVNRKKVTKSTDENPLGSALASNEEVQKLGPMDSGSGNGQSEISGSIELENRNLSSNQGVLNPAVSSSKPIATDPSLAKFDIEPEPLQNRETPSSHPDLNQSDAIVSDSLENTQESLNDFINISSQAGEILFDAVQKLKITSSPSTDVVVSETLNSHSGESTDENIDSFLIISREASNASLNPDDTIKSPETVDSKDVVIKSLSGTNIQESGTSLETTDAQKRSLSSQHTFDSHLFKTSSNSDKDAVDSHLSALALEDGKSSAKPIKLEDSTSSSTNDMDDLVEIKHSDITETGASDTEITKSSSTTRQVTDRPTNKAESSSSSLNSVNATTATRETEDDLITKHKLEIVNSVHGAESGNELAEAVTSLGNIPGLFSKPCEPDSSQNEPISENDSQLKDLQDYELVDNINESQAHSPKKAQQSDNSEPTPDHPSSAKLIFGSTDFSGSTKSNKNVDFRAHNLSGLLALAISDSKPAISNEHKSQAFIPANIGIPGSNGKGVQPIASSTTNSSNTPAFPQFKQRFFALTPSVPPRLNSGAGVKPSSSVISQSSTSSFENNIVFGKSTFGIPQTETKSSIKKPTGAMSPGLTGTAFTGAYSNSVGFGLTNKPGASIFSQVLNDSQNFLSGSAKSSKLDSTTAANSDPDASDLPENESKPNASRSLGDSFISVGTSKVGYRNPKNNNISDPDSDGKSRDELKLDLAFKSDEDV